MKLIKHFSEFLSGTVNLNQHRIDTLEASVEAIKNFIRDADWRPRVWKFVEQGSWAHNTIIRPVDEKEFDADLLVIVDPVDGWVASDYVNKLGEAFKASGLYKDKVEVWDYCVTIVYATDRRIDIAPCVRGRLIADRLEVCNRPIDEFERTEPVEYTNWFNTKNGYSGANSFRKVTRLIKYLRDVRGDFACPSVLLTTLIGERIQWSDAGAPDFKDVPTTLRTIMRRLDDWLRRNPNRPEVPNPELKSEDFAASMTDKAYADLRKAVSELRASIDAAYETTGKFASILAWREVFGDRFAKNTTVLSYSLTESEDEDEDELDDPTEILAGLIRSDAHHDSGIVDILSRVGRWLWKPSLDRPSHMRQPIWPRADIVSGRVQIVATWRPSQHSPEGKRIEDFEQVPGKGGLWFDVNVNEVQQLPPGHSVRYRITNTGAVAMALGKGRGGFETPQEGTRRWEPLEYRGVHLAEAFVIRDSDLSLVGQSPPFHVVIA